MTYADIPYIVECAEESIMKKLAKLSPERKESIAQRAKELTVTHNLLQALKKATHELNAIRARDGAPQHISWDRGHPMQTDGCTHEYFDSLVEECFAAIEEAESW